MRGRNDNGEMLPSLEHNWSRLGMGRTRLAQKEGAEGPAGGPAVRCQDTEGPQKEPHEATLAFIIPQPGGGGPQRYAHMLTSFL